MNQCVHGSRDLRRAKHVHKRPIHDTCEERANGDGSIHH
jgi:hypothetical protein